MELDADYATGLASCASTDLVTSHAAFGYLAERYGLTQRGITGLRPEDEPSPGALAEIADFVTAHDVRTIYSETLVSPAVAKTLARETGVRTAVLDPIEGLDDASAGADYLAVMRTNLATLRDGQVVPMTSAPMSDEVFRLRDGVIGYGDRPVLRDVDFTLRVGEVVAVLGPNGSGKSTLVKALLRQAQITAGTLEVFGTDGREVPRVVAHRLRPPAPHGQRGDAGHRGRGRHLRPAGPDPTVAPVRPGRPGRGRRQRWRPSASAAASSTTWRLSPAASSGGC